MPLWGGAASSLGRWGRTGWAGPAELRRRVMRCPEDKPLFMGTNYLISTSLSPPLPSGCGVRGSNLTQRAITLRAVPRKVMQVTFPSRPFEALFEDAGQASKGSPARPVGGASPLATEPRRQAA